ncbi:hypothetical protein [Listeria booriae]|nr:hypothetical protein [Listeria booriae]
MREVKRNVSVAEPLGTGLQTLMERCSQTRRYIEAVAQCIEQD